MTCEAVTTPSAGIKARITGEGFVCGARDSRWGTLSRGSVSVVATVQRTAWFQIAAICARSASRAARISTRPARAPLPSGEREHALNAAKQPPAFGVDPGAVQSVLREDFEGVVADVHGAWSPGSDHQGNQLS